ncbi:MAG: ECF transporter S component [Clostridia bacterium]|nr:ECF transporter S component [Clostridia bacterium]
MNVNRTRKIAVTAMLSAVAAILMFIQIPVGIMPAFIKLDISELPALIASMALGPWWGVAVCGVKNVLHMLNSTTAYVGELSNFLLGVAFVLPVGYIYKQNKTKATAVISLVAGSMAMAAASFFINYFITYPLYDLFVLKKEIIISMYSAILPWADTLWECLLVFNVPFTFVKGIICSAVTMVIYKRISNMIKR